MKRPGKNELLSAIQFLTSLLYEESVILKQKFPNTFNVLKGGGEVRSCLLRKKDFLLKFVIVPLTTKPRVVEGLGL